MRCLLVCLLGLVLAGCGSSDSSTMPIEGSDHSLTLIREKDYAWSSGWDLAVVVSHMPDCMRRHHLKHAGDGKFKMEVYRSPQGRWVLRQGKKWYIADSQTCQLQKFETAPPEPGAYVGVFEDKTGELKFNQSPDLKKPATGESK